jgi:dTDP-4-amino-4,6-dideoxygalactose transaminase
MLNTPFAPWPSFDEEELAGVARVLASNRVNYWTGEEGRRFEEEFAAWAGAKHAIALANGTVALDLALHGLGIGPGDEVIVTPRTFIASVSCVVNAGATPVFADVDRTSGNISAATIAPMITPRTRAIIAVHLGGWPCGMDAIMALANAHGIAVIEDCAQAHGARCRGRSVGAIGHIGAWSFCQDKIMTTGGEGGMVTTNDPALWAKMWAFKDHGKSYEAVYQRQHPPGYRWLHESFGTNWRMLEMQAVIGRIQLQRMAEWTRIRVANASRITEALAPFAHDDGPMRVPQPMCGWDGGCVHARYKYYAYVEPAGLANGWTRDRIVAEINAAGVPCYSGSCSEVYLERAFEGTPWRPRERLAVARELGEASLMFLVHPTLTAGDMGRTVEAIGTVLTAARR